MIFYAEPGMLAPAVEKGIGDVNSARDVFVEYDVLSREYDVFVYGTGTRKYFDI